MRYGRKCGVRNAGRLLKRSRSLYVVWAAACCIKILIVVGSNFRVIYILKGRGEPKNLTGEIKGKREPENLTGNIKREEETREPHSMN